MGVRESAAMPMAIDLELPGIVGASRLEICPKLDRLKFGQSSMSYPPPVICRRQRGQRQRRVRHAGSREPSDDNTEDEDSNQDKRYETEELGQRD